MSTGGLTADDFAELPADAISSIPSQHISSIPPDVLKVGLLFFAAERRQQSDSLVSVCAAFTYWYIFTSVHICATVAQEFDYAKLYFRF